MMKKIKSKWGKVILGIIGLIALVVFITGIRYWDSVRAFNRSPERIFQIVTDWIQPPRGNIYDRNGKQLTDYRVMYRLGVNLKQVESRETIAQVLSVVYGYDYKSVMNAINVPYEPGYAEYVELAGYFTKEELATIKKWKSLNRTQLTSRIAAHEIPINSSTKPSLKGLTWKAYKVRYYPYGSVGANFLGFYTFLSGNTGTGNFGVEGYYDEGLNSGSDIHLSLDMELQSQVETLLDETVLEAMAEHGSVLIMEADTGEILVMATTERHDPNNYWTYFQDFSASYPYNSLVSNVYEPGSIFGIFTMAMALEEGVIHPEDTFIDTGKIEMGGVTFTNPQQQAYGEITMAECLTLPSNVCLIWLAQQIGQNTYYEYYQKLGFDQLTNIDLEFEAQYPFVLPGSADWYPSTIAFNAIGQGIALTPIQLVQAASAMSGEGGMVKPHAVTSIRTGLKEKKLPGQVIENPFSEETIGKLNQILKEIDRKNGESSINDTGSFGGIYGSGQVVGGEGTDIGYREDVFNMMFLGWGLQEDQYILFILFEQLPNDDLLREKIVGFANKIFQVIKKN